MTQDSPQEPQNGPGSLKHLDMCTCQASDGIVYCDVCRSFYLNPLKNKDLVGLDKQS